MPRGGGGDGMRWVGLTFPLGRADHFSRATMGMLSVRYVMTPKRRYVDGRKTGTQKVLEP